MLKAGLNLVLAGAIATCGCSHGSSPPAATSANQPEPRAQSSANSASSQPGEPIVGFDRNGNLHHFGARTLDGNSHYRFRMRLPAGRWRFQVRIGQTVGNGSGQSANLIAQG